MGDSILDRPERGLAAVVLYPLLPVAEIVAEPVIFRAAHAQPQEFFTVHVAKPSMVSNEAERSSPQQPQPTPLPVPQSRNSEQKLFLLLCFFVIEIQTV